MTVRSPAFLGFSAGFVSEAVACRLGDLRGAACGCDGRELSVEGVDPETCSEGNSVFEFSNPLDVTSEGEGAVSASTSTVGSGVAGYAILGSGEALGSGAEAA